MDASGAVPLFSVIVPTYGRPRFLGEAVASVLAQRVEELEVVVVDDGSDSAVEPPSSDPRVRVIRRESNGGPAAARNTGLDHSRGRYVAFCDDDDLFSPDRLAIAAEGLARAPIATCWGRYLDSTAGAGGRRLEGNVADTILDGMAPHVGRTALDREIAPRFDERFDAAEDVEWWLRLARDHAVTTVAEPGYLVRRHRETRGRTGLEARIRCRLMLLDLYSEYFASHPRAAAFLWKRVGLMASALGDARQARRAFARSLRLRPEAKTAWHLGRALILRP